MDVTGQIMPSKKYFIAIVIPDPFQAEIEKIKQELFENHGLKGALRSPSHITLHRPFEWKEEKENILIEKLSAFSFQPKFELQLYNFASFEPRVIFVNVLPSVDLEALHKNLASYCKKELRLFNEVEDMRGFHPHVTVAFRDLKKNRFCEVWEAIKKETFEANFMVENFVLLKLDKKWDIHETFQL